ncbi:hypothetical protein BKD30_03905 [Tersicoccus phoenicis]|uniref:Uncharacterized protein n=1 Tax=Tersicoccus phoenicis TaxID=554083 RepID=A0A1R1LHN8_9MICC|nr:Rv3235 family protein [Tersicoccus phoenicis]OMH27043.1 hypothetical protein BKD30_03905 [Tersicoccus phoenicis]
MNTGIGAAAPLPRQDEPTGRTSPGRSEPVPVPPPITTRWAPVQRTGAPPLRRRPSAVAPPVSLGVATGASAGDDDRTGPDREPARVLPLEDETTRRVIAQTRAVGQAILEVLAGARPASQLIRWMDPTVHDALVLRADLVRAGAARAAARGGPGTPGQRRPPFRGATVRSVHACRVTARRYELSLVISEPGRCRAMALRLELRHLQWRVTALQIG